MFSQCMGPLLALRGRSKDIDDVIEAIVNVIGQCSADLMHAAPIGTTIDSRLYPEMKATDPDIVGAGNFINLDGHFLANGNNQMGVAEKVVGPLLVQLPRGGIGIKVVGIPMPGAPVGIPQPPAAIDVPDIYVTNIYNQNGELFGTGQAWFGTGGTTSISGTTPTTISLSQSLRTSTEFSASGSGVALGLDGVYICSIKVNGVPNSATSPFTYMLNAVAQLNGSTITGSLATTKWEIFSAGGLDTNTESVSSTFMFSATAGGVLTLAAFNGAALADFDATDATLAVQYLGPAV